MAGLRVLLVLLCLVIPAGTAQDESHSLRAELGPPTRAVNPGENVTLVVTLENNSEQQVQAHSELLLPESWRPVIPLGQVVLAAESRQVIPFVVQTSPRTPPGQHLVTLHLSPADGGEPVSASQAVEVATVVDLSLRVVDAPRVIVQTSYTFQAQVRNDGNSRATVRVDAGSNLNATVEVVPSSFTIEPGRSRELEVRVTDLSQLDRARSQYITLSLYEEGEEVDQQFVAVERVPSVLPETSAYRLFPLELTAQARGTLRGQELDDTNFSITATGAGALAQDGRDRLSFRISDALLRRNSRNHLRYARGTFQGTIGDVYFALPGFQRSIHGPGFSLASDVEVPGFRRVRVQLAGAYNEHLEFGATFDLQLDDDVTLQPFFSFTNGQGFHGVAAQFDADLDTELHLRLSPALAAAHGEQGDGLDPAAGLQGEASWLGNRFRVGSHYRGSSWSADNASTWDNSFAVRLMLNELAAQPPFEQLAVPETTLDVGYQVSHSDAIDGSKEPPDRRFEIGVLSRPAWGALELRYERRATGPRLEQRGTAVASNVGAGPFTVAGRINWNAVSGLPPEGTTENWLFEASGTAGLWGGGFGARIQAQLSPRPLELDQLTLAAQWDGPIAAGVQAGLGTEYRLRGYRLLDMEAGLEVSLRDGSTVGLGSRLRLFRDREPALEFRASYTYPFDVRLGLRSDIGAVYGRVTDASGEPLPDLIVSIAGNSTSTDAQGNFRFPAVEEGERYLQIMPGQLPGDWSVAPANLVLVEVVPGEEHRVDLQAAPTARVRGRFVYRAPDDAGEDVILGMAGPAAGERALSGIRVQARMGERVRSVTSDSAGNFSFEMLPHGEWRLSVSAPQLEGYYRIEPAILQLELAPGEEREVEVSVIPVPRRLQIFDGGTIGVP